MLENVAASAEIEWETALPLAVGIQWYAGKTANVHDFYLASGRLL